MGASDRLLVCMCVRPLAIRKKPPKTAILAQIDIEAFSLDYRVEILAEAFSPYTTSDGAAGLWEPILLSDTSEELVERWAIETYQ